MPVLLQLSCERPRHLLVIQLQQKHQQEREEWGPRGAGTHACFRFAASSLTALAANGQSTGAAAGRHSSSGGAGTAAQQAAAAAGQVQQQQQAAAAAAQHEAAAAPAWQRVAVMALLAQLLRLPNADTLALAWGRWLAACRRSQHARARAHAGSAQRLLPAPTAALCATLSACLGARVRCGCMRVCGALHARADTDAVGTGRSGGSVGRQVRGAMRCGRAREFAAAWQLRLQGIGRENERRGIGQAKN